MPDRHLPVRPDLAQLRHQAEDLLRASERGDPDAVEIMRRHTSGVDRADVQLDDARHALAAAYGLVSWPRLELACRVTDAIWRDDVDALRALVIAHPDEIELLRWLLAAGADANARAAVDGEGFGGHTALFGCVVSQPYRAGRRRDDAFARLLLDHGADVHARASLRKRLRFVADETTHSYREVTPIGFGLRFHDQAWVSGPVLELLAARGGEE